MRPASIAMLALACAVLGGAAALGLADVVGFGDSTKTTVYVPSVGNSPAATRSLAQITGTRFDPVAIYQRRSPGVVTIYADLGSSGSTQGSGFVVDDKGTILTNAHVITNVAEIAPADAGALQAAESVVVEFPDGERVPARIVGWDRFSDVGALRVDPRAHRLDSVPLGDSDRVVVGEPVAAIGSPFGNRSSLTVGVVSATRRSIESLTSRYTVADAIQTDAPINKGNSGGPLFDAAGRVIGINAQIRSASGASEGVGFAIPINSARRALQQLVATGTVAYAYIGITTQDVTPGLARRFSLPASHGALVARVEKGSPAAKAGIRGGSKSRSYAGLDVSLGGDLIVRIGATKVRSAEDVSRLVTEKLLPGQRVAVVFLRDGQRSTVDVTLAERPVAPGG
jgi:S1-C subfamily serine protease